jgi:hypothetical protein
MRTLTTTRAQEVTLVLLRTLIGWHFLYEGLMKPSARVDREGVVSARSVMATCSAQTAGRSTRECHWLLADQRADDWSSSSPSVDARLSPGRVRQRRDADASSWLPARRDGAGAEGNSPANKNLIEDARRSSSRSDRPDAGRLCSRASDGARGEAPEPAR